jgi:hypothetical protein
VPAEVAKAELADMGVLEEHQVTIEALRKHVDRGLDEIRDQFTDVEEKFNRGNKRFTELEERQNQFEEKLDANNAMTAKGLANTDRLVEIFTAFEGFVKVGGWMGNALKWFAAVAIAVGVIWYVLKTGGPPAPK